MTTTPTLHSPNFDFLREHGNHLVEYAARAERYVLDDPNTTLIKLRQLAEELAELAAAYTKTPLRHVDGFSELLRQLKRRHIITQEMADIFHGLRKIGNAAAHEGAGTRHVAITQLKLARRLAVWFHQAFRDPHFRPTAFALPPNPPKVSPELKEELDRLRLERWNSEREADETEEALRKALQAQEAADARAEAMYAELETALALAEETEARQAAMEAEHRARVKDLQALTSRSSDDDLKRRRGQAQEAAARFDLTEGESRDRIDAQLRAQGWEADSVVRTWQNGARPAEDRNQAIAFYPAGDGHADYALFCGQAIVGIIEAKRRNLDLRAALNEAAAHAQAYQKLSDDRQAHAEDFAPGVPFLFASNGRPFTQADDEKHGIWFLERRTPGSSPVAMKQWPTPEDLTQVLSDPIAPQGP